jgi:hypothetical protein
LETEYIVTSGIVPSSEYQFQVRAQNKWGWGPWSTIVTVKASTWPEVVTGVATSIDADTGDVIIDWDEPDSRGDPIFKYVIEFRDGVDDSTWSEELVDCNG